jgi:hypothetical protein
MNAQFFGLSKQTSQQLLLEFNLSREIVFFRLLFPEFLLTTGRFAVVPVVFGLPLRTGFGLGFTILKHLPHSYGCPI